jgi:hypothetical protein
VTTLLGVRTSPENCRSCRFNNPIFGAATSWSGGADFGYS